ncbi:MAG: transposase, partial [Burkholderiales bacterium]|nr:transposase [Burkholderiales bacterium]
MTNYRRNFIPGGTFFFTVVLAQRSAQLLVQHVDTLKSAFRTTRLDHPFSVEAVVVLPDHLHCIWTLPPEDCDFATRWKKIKASFSRHIPKDEQRSASRIDKGERGIWQRRYWEHTIRDERDLQTHVDYIHFNPVKHGYVDRVRDWPYSSFHRYVRSGMCPLDWAGGETISGLDYG